MKIIAYYRVSTRQQGESGLGLEGQQAAVQAFAKSNAGHIIRAYTEVESGKRNDRPELARALAHARLSKATLVVAKLDRLARNVAFLSALMESKVPFIACDNPHATRLTIHILAAVAEAEAVAISQRTKAALNAYKARGGLLGAARPECRENLTPEAADKGRQLSARLRSERAKEAYAELVPHMAELREQGLTLRETAERLNAEGYTSARGNPWSHVQVKMVLDRAAVAVE